MYFLIPVHQEEGEEDSDGTLIMQLPGDRDERLVCAEILLHPSVLRRREKAHPLLHSLWLSRSMQAFTGTPESSGTVNWEWDAGVYADANQAIMAPQPQRVRLQEHPTPNPCSMGQSIPPREPLPVPQGQQKKVLDQRD